MDRAVSWAVIQGVYEIDRRPHWSDFNAAVCLCAGAHRWNCCLRNVRSAGRVGRSSFLLDCTWAFEVTVQPATAHVLRS